jgi:predicted outer membrane repeat protein
MEIRVHSKGRPLVKAVVRIESKTAPTATLKTDQRGMAHAAMPPGRCRVTVSRLRFQRQVRLVNGEELGQRLVIEMRAVNAWYALHRLLQGATGGLALVPVAAAFAPTVRVMAKVAAWMAGKPALVRHGALLLFVVTLLIAWAVHEYSVSRWSASYYRWMSSLGFPIPQSSENQQTQDSDHASKKTRFLGPGEVIVGETIVVERGAHLIIQPGTTLRFAESTGIQVHGELTAEGTAEQPIVLESDSPLGSTVLWSGIYVGAEPTGEQDLERIGAASFACCRFKHGGGFQYEGFSTELGWRPKLVASQGRDRTRGGALFVFKPAACAIVHCSFADCQAAWGGALYLREAKGVVVQATLFENNSAEAPTETDLGGGAVCMWASSPSFRDCTFCSNVVRSAIGSGGAVYVAKRSIPAFRKCAFSDNQSGRFGGAVFANDTLKGQDDEGGLTSALERELFEQCTFERNQSAEGGAIACRGRVSPNIVQCTFVDNAAREGTAVSVSIAPQYLNPESETSVCTDFRFEGNAFRYAKSGSRGTDVVFRLGSGSKAHLDQTFDCGQGPDRRVKVQVKVFRETIDSGEFCKKLERDNEALRPTRVATRSAADAKAR